MKQFLYVFMCLFMISCSTEELPNEIILDNVASGELNEGEGEFTTINYGGIDLKVQEQDSVYLFEGDILIPKEKRNTNKSAAIGEDNWWSNNTVPYYISSTLSSNMVDRIRAAISHWEATTNLTFVERTSQTDYVYFNRSSGCSAYVGKTGGRQYVNLGSECTTGNVIHEIGHAVGLWHEQSRADRDEHITIHYDNIQNGMEHNFRKYPYGGMDLTPYFDFSSIMMYPAYAFSANGQPTITTKEGQTFSVQRRALSSGDVYGINIMYPPIQDADGDGVIDEEDECPTEVGESLNDGCPWINGENYYIYDTWVLRHNDTWMFYSRINGWREVYLRGHFWMYR